MTKTEKENRFQINGEKLFQLFKYSLYLLLSMNVYHFFVVDYAASSQTFANGIEIGEIIQAYTATIDTAAWVVLLLLFELETYVLDDEKLKGGLKWSMNFLSLVAYTFIIYSFYGYVSKYIMLHTLVPFSVDDACSLVGSTFTYIDEIDEYLPFSAEICQSFNNLPLQQISGTEIITTQERLLDAQRLSVVEVINSADWLIIVFLLEAEVYLQLRGRLTKKMLYTSKWIKSVLYSVLLLAAIYWGIEGDFLDFWDAFLWLLAFVFIELNIFEWNAETSEQEDNALSETNSTVNHNP